MKSLDQRAKTILKVAREIVRQQDAFLVLGVQHLRPLNLRTVADAIDMHESTVSRVTSNKYIATPRGIFEMKYFFTTAIASSERRRGPFGRDRPPPHQGADRPRREDVLSDDTIVEMLKGRASTSPAARLPSTGKRWEFRLRSSAAANARSAPAKALTGRPPRLGSARFAWPGCDASS